MDITTKENNKNVLVYIRACIDLNNNIKKELLLSIDPHILKYRTDGSNGLILDDKYCDSKYVKKYIVKKLPKKYIDMVRRNYPNSKNVDSLYFINTYFRMFLISYEKVIDIIDKK